MDGAGLVDRNIPKIGGAVGYKAEKLSAAIESGPWEPKSVAADGPLRTCPQRNLPDIAAPRIQKTNNFPSYM